MVEPQQLTVTEAHERDGEKPRVLVAYATKYGSTKGVAERIATILRSRGHRTELSCADRVADASRFAAVVLGSAVFNQRWLPECEQFVDRNRAALVSLPVWLFSVGTFGDRKPLIGSLMTREPHDIRALEQAIHPRGYRVFAGVIDRSQWPFVSRLFFHLLGGRVGDNRDWPAIEQWANEIARELT